MITFRLHFSAGFIRRLLLVLASINIVLSLGTMVFNLLWEHISDYRGFALGLLNYVLVQFNLSTENVVASWYSSMVLLAQPSIRESVGPGEIAHGGPPYPSS